MMHVLTGYYTWDLLITMQKENETSSPSLPGVPFQSSSGKIKSVILHEHKQGRQHVMDSNVCPRIVL